ncbi:MAG: glycoside hydrolase family 53 protein [Candidatus Hodarchaeales archaeon]|jgi:arabinogalactan endo-1,4-beta-galactosidase
MVFVIVILSQVSQFPLSVTGISYSDQKTLSIRGVDISFLPEIEENGGKYYLNGEDTDLVLLLKNSGVNSIRLRIWNNPTNEYCGKNQTLVFARRISDLGLTLLLDFHYSDTWADPGHQDKPLVWDNLTFIELKNAVYMYTHEIISSLRVQGTLPSIVQIGNEITGGMLWNEGKVGGSYDTVSQWTQFTELLKVGIKAVHDAAQGESIQIMIHSDRGGDNAGSRWLYDNILAYNVSFDIIGLSYYPWWHGSLTDLKSNLMDLTRRYSQDICVVETSYPWTLDWYDTTNNKIGLENQLLEGYPATVQGQLKYLKDLFNIVKNSSNSRGLGVYYWAPEVISTATRGSTRENLGFFDFGGNVLDSLQVFSQTSADSSTTTSTEFTSNSTSTTSFHMMNAFSLFALVVIVRKLRKSSPYDKE